MHVASGVDGSVATYCNFFKCGRKVRMDVLRASSCSARDDIFPRGACRPAMAKIDARYRTDRGVGCQSRTTTSGTLAKPSTSLIEQRQQRFEEPESPSVRRVPPVIQYRCTSSRKAGDPQMHLSANSVAVFFHGFIDNVMSPLPARRIAYFFLR